MANSLYTLALDFSKELNYTKAIMARQGDKGITIEVRPFLSGLKLDTTGATFTLKGTTPKGKYVESVATSVTADKIVFSLDGTFMSESGYYENCYVEYKKGNEILTTQDIIFFSLGVSDISQGQADEYVSQLEELIRKYNETFDAFMAEIEGRVDSLNQQITDLTGQAKTLQDKLDALKEEISKLGNNLKLSEAWAWSKDGTDRFTRKYPGENYILNSKTGKEKLANAGWDDAYAYLSETINGNSGEFEVGFDLVILDEIAENTKIDITLQTKGGGLPIQTIFPYRIITINPNQTIHITNKFTADYSTVTAAGARIAAKFGGIPTVKVRLDNFYLKCASEFPENWTPAPSEDYENAYPQYRGVALLPSDLPDDYSWDLAPEYVEENLATDIKIAEITGKANNYTDQKVSQINSTLTRAINDTQVYKLTKNDGNGFRLSDITTAKASISDLRVHKGYIYLSSSEMQVMTDYANIPETMKTNVIGYILQNTPDIDNGSSVQILYTNVANDSIQQRMAFRRVSPNVAKPWVEVADMASINTINTTLTEIQKPVKYEAWFGNGGDLRPANAKQRLKVSDERLTIGSKMHVNMNESPLEWNSDRTEATFTRDCSIMAEIQAMVEFGDQWGTWCYLSFFKDTAQTATWEVGYGRGIASGSNYWFRNEISASVYCMNAKVGDKFSIAVDMADGKKLTSSRLASLHIMEL